VKWLTNILERAEHKEANDPVFQIQGRPLTYEDLQKALKILIKSINLEEKKYY